MFYVYELRDPRDHSVFYVGKGQGERAQQHQREVLNGTAVSNPAKIAKIKAILAAGRQVEVVIVAEYDYEDDALDHEYTLIDADPTLTNVAAGGYGATPLRLAGQRVKRLKRLLVDLERVRQAAVPSLAVGYDARKRSCNPASASRLHLINVRVGNVRQALKTAEAQLAKLRRAHQRQRADQLL